MSKNTHNTTVNLQQYTAYTHDTHVKSVGVVPNHEDTVMSGERKQLSVDVNSMVHALKIECPKSPRDMYEG